MKTKFVNEGFIKTHNEPRKPDTKSREAETEAEAGRKKKYCEAEAEAEFIKKTALKEAEAEAEANNF